eukprot:4525849-Pyramimonas_sp.AAC.1
MSRSSSACCLALFTIRLLASSFSFSCVLFFWLLSARGSGPSSFGPDGALGLANGVGVGAGLSGPNDWVVFEVQYLREADLVEQNLDSVLVHWKGH